MSRDSSGGRELVGLAAVAVAACCGLPVLLGVGLATAAVGIGLGSLALVGVGLVVAARGVRRRRSRAESTCDGASDEIAGNDPGLRQPRRSDAPRD